MSKHMEIRNSAFEKLGEFKGEGSWSDAIESLIEKAKGYVPDAKPTKAHIGNSHTTDLTEVRHEYNNRA